MKKEQETITETTFRNLFFVDRENTYSLTNIYSNLQQVVYDRIRKFVSFYELDDISKTTNAPKGTIGMVLKHRIRNYKELCKYLTSIGESWRFERIKEV